MKPKTQRRLNKKFRFQLFAQWIIENYEPCRVADIGGGKGLLSYFLNKAGFQSTVIDPFDQPLPVKYKDIVLNKRILMDPSEAVPRITTEYAKDMAKDFDLLISLHAHGCNMMIIEGAAEYDKKFILLPCCVIDEPIDVQKNVNWFESLDIYAKHLGHDTQRETLNFKGQAEMIFVNIES